MSKINEREKIYYKKSKAEPVQKIKYTTPKWMEHMYNLWDN